MRLLKCPEQDDLIHLAFRRPGSSHYDYKQTACLYLREDDEPEFERVPGQMEVNCPFCIRDGTMPEEIRELLTNRLQPAPLE